MSADWKEFSIEEIASRAPNSLATGPFGSAISSKFFQDNGIPVIRGSNLSTDISNRMSDEGLVYISPEKATEFSRSIVRKGDLVFTCWGTINQVGLITEDLSYKEYVISNKQMKLTVDPEKADALFLYYLFSSPAKQAEILANGIGAAVPGFNLGQLKSHRVKLPPIDAQKNISSFLNTLDIKIRKNTQINQTLESIAQAIFKSWFVDFEPVKAKMAALAEGGTREQAELAAMGAISGLSTDGANAGEPELAQLQQQNPEHYQQLAETAALFPSAMAESELGEIPEGWEVAPIGNLIESTIGGDWGKEEPDDKHQVQVRIIRGTDIPNIKTCNDKAVPTRFAEEKKLKNRALMFGDIVIEVSGGSPTQPTGRSIFISKEILARMEYPVAPASFCRLFRPKSIDVGFFIGIYLQIIYTEGKTWLYQNQSTGISNFQTTVFLEKELLAIPSNLLIESFVKTISPIIGKMDSNENTKLAEIRDSLLPKLLSGEIDLSDIQSEVA